MGKKSKKKKKLEDEGKIENLELSNQGLEMTGKDLFKEKSDNEINIPTPEVVEGEATTINNEKKKNEEKIKDSNDDPTLIKKKKIKKKKKNALKKSKVKSKKGDIHVGDQINNIINNTPSHIGAELGFKDPSKLLEKVSDSINQFFKPEVIGVYKSKVESQRILTISCHDEDLTNDAMFCLLDRFKEYEHRMVSLTSDLLNESMIKFDSFVDNKIGEKNGEKVVVVLDIRDKKFIEHNSKTKLGALSYSRIKQRLESKQILLICLAHNEKVRKQINKNKDEFGLSFWEIPFLEYYLKKNLPHKKEKEILEIIDIVTKQKARGLWGNNDEDFYRRVKTSVRGGMDKFLDEIEKKKKYKKGDVKKFLEENIEVIKPESFVNDSNPLNLFVTYVASYFPDLRLHEFRRLVSFMLQNEEIELLKSEEVIKNGKSKITQKKVSQNAAKYWESNSDKLMNQCYLISKPTVDFSESYLRENLIKFFERNYPNFLQKQHDKIINSNLFFDDNLSHECIKNIYSLCAIMASEEPKYYGFNLLVSIAEAIGNQQPTINLNTPPEKLRKALEQVVKVEIARQYIINRLADLMTAIHEYENLKNEIKGFLNLLINNKWHEFTLHLLRRMPHNPQFDKLFWVKQLLDRGDDKTRKAAYRYLLQLAQYHEENIYDYLSIIRTWFPEEDSEEPYSHSAYCAIRFILDYTHNSFNSIVKPGQYPTTYPLFISEENDDDFGRKKFLLEWLYHPDMSNAYEVVNRLFIDELPENILSLDQLRVSVIEVWYKVLFGFKKKKSHKKNVKIYKRINEGLISVLRKNEKDVLIISIRKRLSRYAIETSVIENFFTIENKSQLKEKENIVKRLQKNYRVLEQVLARLECG